MKAHGYGGKCDFATRYHHSYLNRWFNDRYTGFLIVFLTITYFPFFTLFAQPQDANQTIKSGQELYLAACASCHGADGRGESQVIVGFDTPLPDFTDCQFASREPDADWIIVAHEGGPVRGFSEMMPAFGEALTEDELQRIISFIRNFCDDAAWPRGELNLPRPLNTEKAFPEDEAVVTTTIDAEGSGSVKNDLLYERRFGSQNQVEVNIPVSARRLESSDWRGGIGDISIGYKRVLFHSIKSGAIFSLGGEIILPTGKENDGLGKGFTIFEAFTAFGKILPSDGFFHFQGGIEVPTDRDRAKEEIFWKAAGGKTFAANNGFGRSWSPMLEVLGVYEVEEKQTQWDLVPQMQVSLNTRQHILLGAGVRIPVSNADLRPTQIMLYLLWDWFDGGIRDGW